MTDKAPYQVASEEIPVSWSRQDLASQYRLQASHIAQLERDKATLREHLLDVTNWLQSITEHVPEQGLGDQAYDAAASARQALKDTEA